MTRRRDLMCEDIFGCDHKPAIPISDDATGVIVEWRCRCGRVVPDPKTGSLCDVLLGQVGMKEGPDGPVEK